jgi:hypothetical protein
MQESDCIISDTPIPQTTTLGKTEASISFVQPEEIKVIPDEVRQLIQDMEIRADSYDTLEELYLSMARVARRFSRNIRICIDNINDHHDQEQEFRKYEQLIRKGMV